jgi:AhpD family alkylhydroperoxidase
LSDYLALTNRKTSLSVQEKEIVNLVISQVNDCAYCLAAHTATGIINSFTTSQTLEIRSGRASFNSTFDSLAQYVKNVTKNRSKPSSESIANLFSAGYTKAKVIDIVMLIGDKTISNYLHGTTQVPVAFPAAAAL